MLSHIGRYRLLKPIAQGGMAEIYFARQEGLEGFQKDVTVKRVLPQFSQDSDFVQMFLDEARLSARLSHPNVVQVFDFGHEDGSYYLAMEFLNGEDLSKVLRLLHRRNEHMPFDVVASVIADAAAGLHYAHTLANEVGEPLGIVHRDVSPSNIFLTYQGAVKVLDFGIAKMEGKVLKTQTGVLKGKHLYMSPEQIRSEPLTGQSDVFALGVVLYEMLTGRRAFHRDNEIAVLQAILVDGVQPPSSYRSDVPAALDDICMRCLTRDLSQRTQSGEQLRSELLAVMGSRGGSDRVRAYMQYLFGKDAAKDKRESLAPDDERGTIGLGSGPSALKPTLVTADPPKLTAPSPPWRKPMVLAAAISVLVGAAALFVMQGGDPPVAGPLAAEPSVAAASSTGATETVPNKPAEAQPAAPPSSPPVAAAEPSAPTPSPQPPATEPAPQATAEASASAAPQKAPARSKRRAAKRQRPAAAVDAPAANSPPAGASASGFLTVNCIPWCRIYVDGKDTGKNSPLRDLPLSPGRHTLKVVNPPTGKSEERSVEIVSGKNAQSLVRF